mgnify:FL=1
MKIRVVLTGRSYHQAAALPDELELPDGSQLSDALAAINQQLSEDAVLPATCLIALAGQHVGNVAQYDDRPLADGQELTLVAPVAGG